MEKSTRSDGGSDSTETVVVIIAVFLIIIVISMKNNQLEKTSKTEADAPDNPIPNEHFRDTGDTDLPSVTYNESRICASGYYGHTKPEMLYVDFCKFFNRPSLFSSSDTTEVFIGKYIVGDNEPCYLIAGDRQYTGNGGLGFFQRISRWFGFIRDSEEFLTSSDDRFWYISAQRYSMTGVCHPVPFNTTVPLETQVTDSNDITVATNNFLLSRAHIYSEICGGHQLLPALFSVIDKSCLYTEYDSTLLRTKECEILCDKQIPAVDDVWYTTNFDSFSEPVFN